MADAWSVDEDVEKNRHNWSGEPKHRPPTNPDSTGDGPKAIDLFCGPGGLSQGLEQAGFETVLGVDIHEPSIETFQRNHPGAHAILGDIRDINGRDGDERDISGVIETGTSGDETLLGSVAEAALGGDELAVLTAGIPCQGFSIANRKQHDEDERNYLFEEFIRAVNILDPAFVLIENVSTMRAAKDGEFVDAILECLRRLGYTTDHRVLSAENYGIPQKRRRLFFLGTREDCPLLWPEPTHEDAPRTVADALSDLPLLAPGEGTDRYDSEPESSFAESMRETPVAGDTDESRLHNHTAPNHRQTTIDRVKNTEPGEPMYDRFKQRIRLDPDEPGPTIIAGGIRPQFQYGHPEESRGLSVRERARIQTFPDGYAFEGGVVQGRVQTGMAVPPLLAQRIGNAIAMSRKAAPFRRQVLEWGRNHRHTVPWRAPECTPYEALVGGLLSEDNPTEEVEPVYLDFIERYRDFDALKTANRSELATALGSLEGADELAGVFRTIANKLVFSGIPDSRDALGDLPGVSRRVVNTTLSFGFNRSVPVIDSRIERVYSRAFGVGGDEREMNDTYRWTFAESMLPDDGPAYNRAISALADDVCTAAFPDCEACPANDTCEYYR